MIRKLSEMTTDELADVLCELTPVVNNIFSDQDFIETLCKGVDSKGLTKIGIIAAGIKRLVDAIPILLKTHRRDIYEIVAIMHKEDKTADDIARQHSMTTLKQVRALFNDKELIDFFKSWGRGEEVE